MTMTATSTSGWNPTLASAAVPPGAGFVHQQQQHQQQHQQQQQQQYQQPSHVGATATSTCLCSFCSPCACVYCLQQRRPHHQQQQHQQQQQHHHHQLQNLSPSFPEQHQQQQQQHQQQQPASLHTLQNPRLPAWGAANCFPLARGSPFGGVPNPITGDHGSSDEALSPPHQDDPLDDIMDAKEASRLQQEIVKSWRQKKRSSCEMKTRTQDKYRQVYNSQQRFELEKEYQYQKYITTARKSELSGSLHLSERQIKIWFQNRRAKERRQKKDSGKQARRDSGASPGLDSFVKEVEVKQEQA